MENVPSAGDESRTAREGLHKMLGEMLINITDQVFENGKFYIDGYRFINCSFIKCELTSLRGTFEFHHCLIFDHTRPILNCEAMKAVQFYHSTTQFALALPSFKPVIHKDGTLSIGQGVSLGL